jgi:hypothetical protein
MSPWPLKVYLVLCLQGYLAYKKPPHPWDHHRALGMRLLYGPRGGRFLSGEVPV